MFIYLFVYVIIFIYRGNVYANQQGDQFSGGLGAAVNAKSTVYTQNVSLEEKPQLLNRFINIIIMFVSGKHGFSLIEL